MKSNKFLKKLIVAVLSLGILLPAGVSENHNFAQAVTNGWHKKGSDWYYYMGGKPLKNQWYNDYYLKSDGKMAKSEWISAGGDYYIGSDGKYVKNTWVNGYYLGTDGKMVTSRWIYDKNNDGWYYLGYFGKYYKNAWKGDYYLKSDGKMAHDEWIGKYYFGKDGKWVK